MALIPHDLGGWHFETRDFVTTKQVAAWRLAVNDKEGIEQILSTAIALRDSGFVSAINFPIDADSDIRPIRWLSEETAKLLAELLELPKV